MENTKLEHQVTVRFDDNMVEYIHEYRGSKKPPLTFSEATRDLLQQAIDQKEAKNETSKPSA